MTAFRKMFPSIMVIMTLLVINSDKACAADPDMLQDICPADLTSTVKVNGYPCKNTSSTDDFTSRVLSMPGVVANVVGIMITRANVQTVPGLNTLGELLVGFITTDNDLFSKVIKQGEVFVSPRGLVHFQKNVGRGPAATIVAFNSQLPGVQVISITLFQSSPPVPNDILAQTFRTTPEQIALLRKNFV
ncbi:Nectarin-1 [Capsicum annuum]|nr:Nectarin-1 [Capsicum annuum]KAF3616796.1 Nectarin-1 [Capsicum annuum]